MPKKPPSRPERRIASIKFPKDGPPHHNIEDLPVEQGNQELAIVNKLLGAITHYGGEHYRNPRIEKEEPFDIVCEREDGRKIGIQVAGPRDKNILSAQKIRRSYKKAIETKHHDVLSKFPGCIIYIVDTGSHNYLPKFGSKVGQRIIKQLVDCLIELSSDIDTLPVKKIRNRLLLIGPNNVEVSIQCLRTAGTDDVSFSFEWTGGIAGSMDDRVILSDTVLNKIKKYAKPKDEFWLLTYTTDFPLTDDHPDIERTREILNNSEHPFNIVWYLHPHPNEDRGHLIKVWPPN